MDNLVIEYNLDLYGRKLLEIESELRILRFHDEIQQGKGDRSETIANIQLAVRHIEDARHRITQAVRAHLRPAKPTAVWSCVDEQVTDQNKAAENFIELIKSGKTPFKFFESLDDLKKAGAPLIGSLIAKCLAEEIGPTPEQGGPVGPQCGCSCCTDCDATHTTTPAAPSAESPATLDEMIQTLKDEEAKGQGQ